MTNEQSYIQLTVISPVFNGRKYIEKCLENVASQRFDCLEHLIMDGGSSDGTPEIVREWSSRFPHIRLISEKDRGQSDAMNKGIREARGSIIGFLNVDDFYEAGILPQVPGLFEQLPNPSFICGNLNIWNPDGSLRHFNRPEKISLIELLTDKFEWPYNPSAYFYHKSLHELCGFYNEQNHYCMDYEFILEAAQCISLRHKDQLWGNFCQVEGSKTLQRFSTEMEKAVAESRNLRDRVIDKLSAQQKEELFSLLRSMENPPAESSWMRRLFRFFR